MDISFLTRNFANLSQIVIKFQIKNLECVSLGTIDISAGQGNMI